MRSVALRHLLAPVAVLVAAVAAPVAAGAQIGPFGQNKIQYRDFDWHVLKGAHVDLYYYPAEERIARVALSYAEESYEALTGRLNHAVRSRIPMIVYASHSDFEQTNVLPFVPPEGVLGVTEFMKRRVTLPFRGSYSEFRRTIRHEMVHVFQLSLLTQQFELYPRARRAGLPLWWSEGLAEYLSSKQDSRDEMVVRDLVLHGRMPTIGQLNMTLSPIVYPLGGELHHFLSRRYGEWRINLMYASLSKYASFDEALRGIYGRSSQELSDEWHYELRQRYFPNVDGRKPLEIVGREIADLALKPVAVVGPDSQVDVAYLSPRTGYTNIYTRPINGPAKPKVVVAGERSPEFESFHAFSSRMDARNGVLIFASKYHDRDALFFWDLKKERVVGRYQFDSLVSIISPAWSHDGRRVAFSGLTMGGVSDIFVFEMAENALHRVTDDAYEDLDPTWLPEGREVVFSSDRAAGGDEGTRNLYVADVASRAVRPLTAGVWSDEQPRWDPEQGRVLFTSDRDGTFNLYSVDTLGAARRESQLDGGVFDPAPVPNDSRVLITGFGKLTWAVYAIRPDSAVRSETFAIGGADSSGRWQWRELQDTVVARVQSRRYDRDFSLDFAAGGSDYVPGYTASAAQLFFSDLLGDHALAVSLAMYQGGDLGDLLSNLNANVFYLNQSQRLNWGVGMFRLAGTFYENDFEQLYRETSSGVYGALRYPLSRFTRIEGQTRLEFSSRDDFANDLVDGPQRRRGFLASNYLSLVGDNALWLETGPIDGMRWNLTGGVVSDVTHGVFENWVGAMDVRRYLRTSLQSAFAVRAYGYISEGTRPRAVQIGGTWLLRGYPRFSLDGTRAWVLNDEFRFPITNFVTFGFPFGAIRFPQVQGALFNDFGQAWYKNSYDPAILGSFGTSFRMGLVPGLVLRLDLGKRYSLRRGDDGLSYANLYRGRFADFFFGYNY